MHYMLEDGNVIQLTNFFAFSSSSSHGRPATHVTAPAPARIIARETRPKNRRLRSMLDSESFDDFAPVRSRPAPAPPASGPSGSKSRLGMTEEPANGCCGSLESAPDGEGGGGGFVGGVCCLLALTFFGGGGGFEANARTDW